MHTLIVYQEDLSYFEDGDHDEDVDDKDDEEDESQLLSLFSMIINLTSEKVMMKLAN